MTPPSDMVAALAAGTVAGFIVADPFNALAEAHGVGRILRFSGDVWRNHACCVTMMHEHDIAQRPDWVHGIVNALTQASAWARVHRVETAELLSKTGADSYTPHDAEILRKVLQPDPKQWQRYHECGAIQHPHWQQQRIDFQPYPFASYSEKLIELLQQTHIAGVNPFLHQLDPARAAQELFDTRFVQTALQQDAGLMASFGLLQGLQRNEEFDPATPSPIPAREGSCT